MGAPLLADFARSGVFESVYPWVSLKMKLEGARLGGLRPYSGRRQQNLREIRVIPFGKGVQAKFPLSLQFRPGKIET